jgi:Mn2+/Fe2+ NRAMP family transporter
MAQEDSPRAAAARLRGWSRPKAIGPGLIIAAAGVGVGDLVSSLVAGTRFETVLIWAIVIGAIIKFTLVEGMGRRYMATGQSYNGGG